MNLLNVFKRFFPIFSTFLNVFNVVIFLRNCFYIYVCNNVVCWSGSIQQLHYEMANNLKKALEHKLRETYIAPKEQPPRHVHDDDAKE